MKGTSRPLKYPGIAEHGSFGPTSLSFARNSVSVQEGQISVCLLAFHVTHYSQGRCVCVARPRHAYSSPIFFIPKACKYPMLHLQILSIIPRRKLIPRRKQKFLKKEKQVKEKCTSLENLKGSYTPHY